MFNFFRDLFRRKESEHIPASSAIETAPLSEDLSESVSQPQASIEIHPPQLVFGVAQSVGIQRSHNEDTLFAMCAILAEGSNDLPLGVFVVADGMGGHLNGEIASGSAAKAFGKYLLKHFYVPFLTGESESEQESIHEVMEHGMLEAHSSVLSHAPGGGTTLTGALVIGDRVTFSHVGDSRAYFIYPDGRIQVMTQDHSLVKRLQDLGQIDEKEASIHPQRNVLYRALGQSEPFKPDIITHALPHSGCMLICSDGLWGTVPQDEILQIVQSTQDPAVACHHLIEAANAAGGPDNISAILVRYLS